MRWFTPVAFTVVAVGVAWTNTTSPDTRIVFPFLEAVVGSDPDVLSQATIALLAGLALVTGVWAAVRGGEGSAED